METETMLVLPNTSVLEILEKTKENPLETDLCRLMIENGSDKCGGWHNYTPYYSSLFDASKHKELNFFELGIGFPVSYKKSSLYGWRQYFTNGNVFAGDVEQSYLINDERIKSYLCNQDDTNSIHHMWNNFFSEVQFDVIVEDGKHEFSSNINFLYNSIHKLKTGGIFIIEDLTHSTRDAFLISLDKIKSELQVREAFVFEINHEINKTDNCLFIIRK